MSTSCWNWNGLSRVARAATVAALVGCAGEPGEPGPSASSTTEMPPPPPMIGQETPPPPQAAQGEQPVTLRRTIGQTTTDIRDFDAEVQRGENFRVSDGKITANDPITLQGNAYVSIVGQAAVLQIQHALNLYNALNDRYPKDTEEFMNEIIHANNIQLPQLPAYQEYAYKPDTHELVVLEFPDRMEGLRRQVRGESP